LTIFCMLVSQKHALSGDSVLVQLKGTNMIYIKSIRIILKY
jgi:hypothetical protein